LQCGRVSVDAESVASRLDRYACSSCFNVAASLSTRNRVVYRHLTAVGSASMWPRLCRRGISAFASAHGNVNGASMWPRLCRRGIDELLCVVLDADDASMWPRLCRRGIARDLWRSFVDLHASMWPRLCRRGIVVDAWQRLIKPMLQCGRVSVDAES